MRYLAIFVLAAVLGCSGPEATENNGGTSNSATANSQTNGLCDCADGQACVDGVCGRVCTDDASCGPARVCEALGDAGELVCVIDDDLPAPEVGGSGTEAFLVRDVTTDCSEPGAAGTDIFAVGLESADGEALGWAEAVAAQTDSANDNTETGVLGGRAPEIGVALCPETFDGAVLSLGCDGAVAVQFRADGELVVADSGMTVRVYAWGEQCTPGKVPEQYQLFACTNAAAVVDDADFATCTLQLGSTHTGEAAISIP